MNPRPRDDRRAAIARLGVATMTFTLLACSDETQFVESAPVADATDSTDAEPMPDGSAQAQLSMHYDESSLAIGRGPGVWGGSLSTGPDDYVQWAGTLGDPAFELPSEVRTVESRVDGVVAHRPVSAANTEPVPGLLRIERVDGGFRLSFEAELEDGSVLQYSGVAPPFEATCFGSYPYETRMGPEDAGFQRIVPAGEVVADPNWETEFCRGVIDQGYPTSF
ncbi:MAG: hypothetical protein KC561_05170 [Myxococcales bacterium]|nr:hypothetical protein [Myxococcales bacterium]